MDVSPIWRLWTGHVSSLMASSLQFVDVALLLPPVLSWSSPEVCLRYSERPGGLTMHLVWLAPLILGSGFAIAGGQSMKWKLCNLVGCVQKANEWCENIERR